MNVELGQEVGYTVRFEDCTSWKTVLKYMTDGILLHELLDHPDLANYSVMIVDEVHERTITTDALLGLLKIAARDRPDMKLLISCATLDAEKFSQYFDGARIFQVPGCSYPVDIWYTRTHLPYDWYVEAAVETVLRVHATEPRGDILVFLAGEEDIAIMEEMLDHKERGLGTRTGEILVCPIYATLPSCMQTRVLKKTPEGARKVVLSTNVAETPLSIEGIRYVIDVGLAKQKSYDPRTGMESLDVMLISKVAAKQRAGRAGRMSPGKCFRLYTSDTYRTAMDDNTAPENQMTNLESVVLMLKKIWDGG